MTFYVSKNNPNSQDAFNKVGMYLHQAFNRVHGDDNLITLDKNLAFLEEQAFTRLIAEAAITSEERGLAWRMHVACWFAKQTLKLSGDFVECGVLRGFTSYVLCRHLNFQDQLRNFWLFDTFNGLPDRYSTEKERETWNGRYQSEDPAGLYAFVQARFAAYPNVRVLQGAVPDVFATNTPNAIAFLHLDMNSAIAERLALEHLFPLLAPGAVVLLDDYGWLVCREQMESAKTFFNAKDLPILELPTGQGVVVIPRAKKLASSNAAHRDLP